MKKFEKVILKSGAIAIAAGTVIALTAYWSGAKTALAVYPDMKYRLIDNNDVNRSEQFFDGYKSIENIEINVSADVEIKKGAKFSVSTVHSYGDMTVYEENGVLYVKSDSGWGKDGYFSVFGINAYIPNDEVVITVPEDAGLSEISVTNDSGYLNISDISSKELRISQSYGSMNLKNISADIVLDLNGAYTEIEEISGGSLTADASYAQFSMMKTNVGTVELDLNGAEAIIEDMTGESLSVKLTYSPLNLSKTDAKTFNFNLDGVDAQIDDITGESLTISSKYGSLDLNRVTAGTLDADLDSVSLTGDRVEFETSDITNSYADINLSGWRSDDAAFTLDSSPLNFEGAITNAIITGKYSDITVNSPGSADDYSVSVNAKYSDLIINGEQYGNSIYQSFAPNGDEGKNIIAITSDSGNVEIWFNGSPLTSTTVIMTDEAHQEEYADPESVETVVYADMAAAENAIAYDSDQ